MLLLFRLMQNPFDEGYYFGNVYGNYDDFLDWDRIAKDIAAKFSFANFLDVGCGCGNLVKELKKIRPDADIHGIDLSEFAVKRADLPTVIAGSCTALPYGDATFDLVHILGTFAYLPDVDAVRTAMTEALRVNKDAVLFDEVYVTPDAKHDDYDPHRKQFLSQPEWLRLWQEVVGPQGTIDLNGDEIIIRKHR